MEFLVEGVRAINGAIGKLARNALTAPAMALFIVPPVHDYVFIVRGRTGLVGPYGLFMISLQSYCAGWPEAIGKRPDPHA